MIRLALVASLLGGCTLVVGHEVEQDFAVPDDASVVVVDAASPPDMAQNVTFTWSATQIASKANLNAVWAGSNDGGTAVYVVGEASTILLSTDEGDTWKAVSSPVNDNFRAVWGRSTSDVFIGGEVVSTPMGGDFVMHGNASAGFTRDTFVPDSAVTVTDIFSSSPSDDLFLSTGCGAYSSDGNGGWDTINSGCAADWIWGTADDDVWLLSDPVVLHSSTGLPNSFVLYGISLPTANLRVGLWGFGSSGTTQSLWTQGASATIESWHAGDTGWTVEHTEDGGEPLSHMWGLSENDLYAVGDDSRILHRTAAGWNDEGPTDDMGAKTPLVAVFGLPDGHVFAVGEFGWIYVRKPIP